MLTDTHCHLDDQKFDADLDSVINNASEVSFIINPGCDIPSSKKAIDISKKYPKVYSAVGIHPNDLESYDVEIDIPELKQLAKEDKVVAIGEIGLDYYYDTIPKEIQKKAFRDQIELAGELNLPYIIHDREAHGDTLEIVKEYPGVKAVFHAFSGSPEMAKEIIKLGHMISIGGTLTFKNNKKTPEVIKQIPLEKIMLETDAPYLTPVPYRGKRNEPAYTKYVAEKIAELKNITVDEVLEQTEKNAREFFNIKIN